MQIITPEFIETVIRSGKLGRARDRVQNGTARPSPKATPGAFSAWSLVCEEILDTEHDDDWYDTIWTELTRRGFTTKQIESMRRFAWRHAGWLNYDRMLWEWVNLDENDIKIALELQLKDGVISQQQFDEGMAMLDHPKGLPEPM
ncbi:MAG TPA: hypothetical protein VKS79_07895 [Gemmataceae bacterium]|nr:hypothetical protein [Gemmataceae bacterium]